VVAAELVPSRQLDRQVAGVANGLVDRARQGAVAVAQHLVVAAAVAETPRAPAVIAVVIAWAAVDSVAEAAGVEAGVAAEDADGKRHVDED
jgi:phage shock protein PspC (stress-responsive transcriptional regulator)